VCGDAGGAAAVAPVIQSIRRTRELRAFAYGPACDVWQRRSIPFERVPDALSTVDAAQRLRESHAAALVTGTSVNPLMHESRFVEAARTLAIPSIAVLDSWVNYRQRFPVRPDRIAVMDEHAKADMIAEGFDPRALVVTGQPASDDLCEFGRAFDDAQRRQWRERLGAARDGLLVLFVSQPFSTMYGGRESPASLGFDEHLVLRLLVDALERVAAAHGRPITLVVRPHPREKGRTAAALPGDRVRIVFSSEGCGREAALAADLVVGMSSALLVDACYLQRITISLQPGLRGRDILPTNAIGVSRAVFDDAGVTPAVEELLVDESARARAASRLRTFVPAGDATERVVALIKDMAAQHQTSEA
jgi:hypothetical protein